LEVLALESYGYGPSFSILGFIKDGTLWNYSEFGTHYQFDEAIGVLSVVPEPTTGWLIGLAALACLLRRRR
jgi:hypothetical protein